MKLNIYDKKNILNCYHLAGHIVALLEYNKNFGILSTDFQNTLHDSIHLFYEKANSDLSYYTLGNKFNTVVYLLSGLYVEFSIYKTDRKKFEICFEDHFETFTDFIRSKINDEYEIKGIYHQDIYPLMLIVFPENKVLKKFRKSNKKYLMYILKVAKKMDEIFNKDYIIDSIEEIFEIIFYNDLISSEDAIRIFRKNKLSKI